MRMTLDEVKQMKEEYINPAIAARVIGCDPHYIRVTAREAPEDLGFPVTIIKSRVKIPRLAFIGYTEGTEVK